VAYIFVLDATTIDKFEYEAADLASKVGGETLMSSYIDNIGKAIESARAGGGKPFTVALIIRGKGGEHMIAGTESFQAAELQAANATPVGPKSTKFEMLSPETLIKDDPDFVITAGPPDDFVKDSRFASLQAVRKGHVFGINQDIAERRGYRVDRFILDTFKTMDGARHG